MLGQFVVADGNQTVAIINLNDSYGNGLADQATPTIEASGGEVVVARRTTRPPRRSTARSTRSPLPTRTRSSSSASTSRRGSCGRWSRRASVLVTAVYGSDGNIGNALGVDFDAGN